MAVVGAAPRLALAACPWVLLVACGEGRPVPAEEGVDRRAVPIVGGTLAEPCEHPPTVAITDVDGWPYCSGTLVAAHVVVTAAHCLEDDDGTPSLPSELRVVHGYQQPSMAPPADRLRVAAATMHPDYEPYPPVDWQGLGLSHDVGVIVLDEPIPNAVPAGIVELAAVPSVLVPGRDLEISGFGVYQYSGDPDQPGPDGLLFKAVVQVVTHAATELLTGSSTGADTCFGDSGGPCYAVDGGALWVMGATSRAGAQAATDCGEQTVFTLLPAYVDWLEATVGAPLGTVAGHPSCGGVGGGAGWGGGSQAGAGPGGEGGAQGASGPAPAPPTSDSDDDGCGCSLPASRRPGAVLVALLLLALGWSRRRL